MNTQRKDELTLEEQKCLLDQTKNYNFETVLDIGAGKGQATRFFKEQSKKVTATGYSNEGLEIKGVKYIEGIEISDLSKFKDKSFDAVWCSHVIEHTYNMGGGLREIRRILKDDGILFLTYPPYFPILCSGHFFQGGSICQMMYQLILCGFDAKNGSFIRHGSNVAGFVKKNFIKLPQLVHNPGDLKTLKNFFPVPVRNQCYAEYKVINWTWRKDIKIHKLRDYFVWISVMLKKFILSWSFLIKEETKFLLNSEV